MPRPKLTEEQKLLSKQKRTAYMREYKQKRNPETKAKDAEYLRQWKENNDEKQVEHTDNYYDRHYHYWTCTVDDCGRCEAVAEYNRERRLKGLPECADLGKK